MKLISNWTRMDLKRRFNTQKHDKTSDWFDKSELTFMQVQNKFGNSKNGMYYLAVQELPPGNSPRQWALCVKFELHDLS